MLSLVKVSIGIALLWVVLRQVDFAELSLTLSQAHYGVAGVAFLLFGLSRFLEGIRLYILTRDSGKHLSAVVRIIFISTFFNNFTAVVVGDGYKVVALSKQIQSLERAVFVVVLERLLGLFAIAAIAIYLLTANPQWLAMLSGAIGLESLDSAGRFLAIAMAMALAAALLVFALRRHPQVAATLLRLTGLLKSVRPAQLLLAILLTVLAQVVLAAMVFTLIIAFAGSVGFEENLLVMLLVYIAAYLPISVGSLGVREGAIVFGLSLFAVSQPVAVAAAVVSRMMIYVYAIAAGVWWSARKS